MFMVICLPYIVRSNRFEEMMEELRNLERNGDTGSDNSGNDVLAERTQLDCKFFFIYYVQRRKVDEKVYRFTRHRSRSYTIINDICSFSTIKACSIMK